MEQLFRKYIEGECSPNEEKQVLAKLRAKASTGELHQFLSKYWYELEGKQIETGVDFDSVLDKIHHSINLNEAEEQKSKYTLLHRFYSWTRVAAVAIIILMASVGVWYSGYTGIFQKEFFYTVSSVHGQSSSIELPDGSRVWLNGGSSVVYSSKYGQKNRTIQLNGEGFFQVEKDKSAPFLVEAANVSVMALGTNFNVEAYETSEPVTITLEEGRVSVESADKKVEIEPGMQVVVRNSDMKVSHVDTRIFTSWHSGLLEFKDEKLSCITRQLAKIYDVEFVFETEDLKNFRYRGAVSLDKSILKALEMLRVSTGIKYEINRNQILLKK
jgi:ferric-dicitrate binding protein FerR (iron transport regulator)